MLSKWFSVAFNNGKSSDFWGIDSTFCVCVCVWLRHPIPNTTYLPWAVYAYVLKLEQIKQALCKCIN